MINVGRDARNVIISRRKERKEVEAYSPSSNYRIPPKAFASFKKYKPANTRPQGKPRTPHHGETSLGGARINKTLQRNCFIHPKSSHTIFECDSLRKALGAPLLKETAHNLVETPCRLVFRISFIQSCKPLPMSNGQGVGLKSQSLSFYNYCNFDKSKIKVDFLHKSTTWLSLIWQVPHYKHYSQSCAQHWSSN